jgi:hypothetical protein
MEGVGATVTWFALAEALAKTRPAAEVFFSMGPIKIRALLYRKRAILPIKTLSDTARDSARYGSILQYRSVFGNWDYE